jgi:hypothetical protein
MVRSRTPKITLHTEEAKCILYDTSPDFEVNYYNGTKTFISKDGLIKIFEYNGNTITIESASRSTCLTPQAQEILEKSSRWHQYCLEEEKLREKRQELYKDIISFPISIGRRPQISKISIISHENSISNSNSLVISSSNNQIKHDESINQAVMKTAELPKDENNENKKLDINKKPINSYKKFSEDSNNIESKYLNMKSSSTSSLVSSPNYLAKYNYDNLDKRNNTSNIIQNQQGNDIYDYYPKNEYTNSPYDFKTSNFSLGNMNNENLLNTSDRPSSSSSYSKNSNFSSFKKEKIQNVFSQNSNYELNSIASNKNYDNSIIPRSASASLNYSQQTNQIRSITPSSESNLIDNFQQSVNLNQNSYNNYNNSKNSIDNIPINFPHRETKYAKY